MCTHEEAKIWHEGIGLLIILQYKKSEDTKHSHKKQQVVFWGSKEFQEELNAFVANILEYKDS